MGISARADIADRPAIFQYRFIIADINAVNKGIIGFDGNKKIKEATPKEGSYESLISKPVNQETIKAEKK